MIVQLTPVSPRSVRVVAADDPYKKFWWAILALFGLTGMWLCLPLMGTSVGSGRVDTSHTAADAGAEQNLDAAIGPAGAPGSPLDLSMGGSYRKKSAEDSTSSMLYSAAPESQAPASAPAGAPGAETSLAQALKSVGDKKDAGGWGGEKARRGFTSPKLAGGVLSGLGDSSGGFGASASGAASAFGTRSSQIALSSTRGLRDDGRVEGASGAAAALRKAASGATQAASLRGGDASVGALSRVFDGAKARDGIGAGADGKAGVGLYAGLDEAPANLKTGVPELSSKEIKAPPTSEAAAGGDDSSAMAQQMGTMIMGVVLAGVLPGAVGQIAAGMMMQMQQQQQARQQEEQQQKKQQNLSRSLSGL
ncbi:MAG TPA: hypothetical protein DCZ01_09735 [Elusimicrobia bacterium]|nr:MAG: hypothetical protein A2X37_09295 [Elusimicrobia bacterium GWA2_66_18]OGR70845.1 MAG: hypothetical protein A2X40_05890 [Elusimicrobia bacterium GWC2_65_9]HAZ08780.1 hypothetical protein [Elusimicrobiota bacterium]